MVFPFRLASKMAVAFGSAQMVAFAFGLEHGTLKTKSNWKMLEVFPARLSAPKAPSGWPGCQLSGSTGRFRPFCAVFHGRYSVTLEMTRSRVTLSASVRPKGRKTAPSL